MSSSGLNSQSSWLNTAELGPLPVTQAPQPILWKMVSLVSITSEILNFSINGINGHFHSDWDLDLNRFEQISAQILSGCGEETRCASHQKEAEAARCRGGPTSWERNGKRLLVEVITCGKIMGYRLDMVGYHNRYHWDSLRYKMRWICHLSWFVQVFGSRWVTQTFKTAAGALGARSADAEKGQLMTAWFWTQLVYPGLSVRKNTIYEATYPPGK